MTVPVPKMDEHANLQIKVMYWGPGEAGKTTCFFRLLDIFTEFRLSKGFSIATTDERTLWNDSVYFRFPMKELKANIIVNVATTTGQERFLSTREYVLENADGAIFIADAHKDKMKQNKRSFEELLAFTRENRIPIVIQLNKRDIDNPVEVREFKDELGLPSVSEENDGFKIVYPSVATDNRLNGVRDAFFSLLQKVLKHKFVNS